MYLLRDSLIHCNVWSRSPRCTYLPHKLVYTIPLNCIKALFGAYDFQLYHWSASWPSSAAVSGYCGMHHPAQPSDTMSIPRGGDSSQPSSTGREEGNGATRQNQFPIFLSDSQQKYFCDYFLVRHYAMFHIYQKKDAFLNRDLQEE